MMLLARSWAFGAYSETLSPCDVHFHASFDVSLPNRADFGISGRSNLRHVGVAASALSGDVARETTQAAVFRQRVAGRDVVGEAEEIVVGRRRGAVAVGLGQEMDSFGENGDFSLTAGADGDGIVGDGGRDFGWVVNDDVESGRMMASLHVLVLFGVENETKTVSGARAVDSLRYFRVPVESVAKSEIGEGLGKVQTAAGDAVPVAA